MPFLPMSLLSQILPKKESKEYFLTLAVEEQHIRAAVVEVSNNQVMVLGMGVSDFAQGENETEASDIAISMAEKSLAQDFLINKVIFALPQAYLEGDDVIPEYLVKLKKIAHELNLKPVGYIAYSTAISYYLEKEEGSAPTVLLMSMSKKYLSFSFIRIGNIQQNIVITRSESILTDFASSLPQFKIDILPARIIIYNESEKIDDVKEELLQFPWHKHSNFLHTPKIEIFPAEKILTAIVESSGSTYLPDQPASKPDAHHLKQSSEEKQVETTIISQNAQEFGFEKIADKKEKTSPVTEENIARVEDNIFSPTEKKLPPLSLLRAKIVPYLSHAKFPSFSTVLKFKNLFLVVPFLAFLALFLFYFLWIYPKSTLYLMVYAQSFSQPVDVTFTKETKDLEEDTNLILVNSLSTEVSGEKKSVTSGKAKVGEKARGEITIFNKTLKSKSFPKGSQLQNGSLKFTLDSDIDIASASDTGEGLVFGKEDAKITAAAIGPESNLAASSAFNFTEFADTLYSARNNNALTKGSSREISSVSLADRDNLEDNLTQELINRAKQNLSQKLSGGETIIDEPVTVDIKAKKFSQEVGVEAKELSLSLTLEVSIMTFNQEDIKTVAQNTTIYKPQGTKIDPSKTTIKVEQVQTDNIGRINAQVVITSYFIPDLDIAMIKNNLSGKTFDKTAEFLESQKGIGGVKIIQEQKTPLYANKLPLSAKNIRLEIIAR